MISKSVPAQRNPRRAGFTLLDTVLSVLILGILAAAATPRLLKNVARGHAEAAANRICADLNLARRLAMARSTSQAVEFSTSTSSYSLTNVDHLNHSSATYAVSLSDEPYQSTISSLDVGGDSTLLFDRFGQPDSSATIIVSAGGVQKTINVNAVTGKATIP